MKELAGVDVPGFDVKDLIIVGAPTVVPDDYVIYGDRNIVKVGLFALPEALALVVGDMTIARARLDTLLREARADVRRGMREAWRHSG